MAEMKIGARELKSRLSEYLRRVKAGETILITERGKPVGRIIPVKPDLEQRLHALVAAGLAEWDGRKFEPRQPVAINRGAEQIANLVIQDRDVDYLP